jgi:hypothetical protein
MIGNSKYTHIIPIGSNCRVSIATREIGLRDSSMPLDWCLSSMKCVNLLFTDGFKDITNHECCSKETFTLPSGNKHDYILNTKYNLNITHEDVIGESFINKYNRRVMRMHEILDDKSSNVLFVRNSLDGIIHDPLHRYYLGTEYDHPSDDSDPTLIDSFVEIIQSTYPDLDFSVLVINHTNPLAFKSSRVFNITTEVNQNDRLWDEKACIYHIDKFIKEGI